MSAIAQRITQARELAGLAKVELANLLSVTQQAVGQWENGVKQPTAENLRVMSIELKFPLALFMVPIPNLVFQRGPITFRAHANASTKKTNKKATRLAELFAEIYLWMGERIKFPANALPDIDFDVGFEEAARQCRRAWGLGDRPILKLGELFESKGIVFGTTAFRDDRFDAFSCIVGGRPFIFLGNEKMDSARTRFDACHELAHLVFHQHLVDAELSNSETLDSIEREANQFAGAFLMPEETFAADVLDATLDGFLKLKAKWAVSVQAMIFRARTLELISENKYTELFRQLSAKGWRRKRSEPLDDCIPIVKRSLGSRALELLESNKVMFAWEIPSALPMPSQILWDAFQSNPEKFEPAEFKKIIPFNFSTAPASALEQNQCG